MFSLTFTNVTLRSSFLKNTYRIINRPFSMETNEFFIPFPGGQIAAKSWGNKTGKPVIALHGWQDNIGTFDRLMPLLSQSFYFVGFDFLGHGLSSHKPPGEFYEPFDMVLQIKRVSDYLKWNEFSILGHSMGGIVGLMYSSIFSENVKSIISLDVIKSRSYLPDKICSKTKEIALRRLEIEAKLNKDPNLYSFEDAKQRLMSATVDKITSCAADVLLQRGTKPCGEKVMFTRDIRLHELFGYRPFCLDEVKAYASNLKSNLLIIHAKQSILRMLKEDNNDDILSIYKTNCKSFSLIEVDGNHFVHLNEPEIIASHINLFLNKYC